jgi:cell wall assembly regulator SMI1
MEKIWKKIEAWLEENAPETLADLNPGATEADIRKAEKALSVRLPEEMVKSYSVHDGQRGGAGPLFGDYALLSLEAAVKEWKTLKKLASGGVFNFMHGKPAPRVRPDWWNPRWVPVASDSAGNFLCADFAPARPGKNGQIISFLRADHTRELVAKDFKSWLSAHAKALEAGEYKVENGWLSKAE